MQQATPEGSRWVEEPPVLHERPESGRRLGNGRATRRAERRAARRAERELLEGSSEGAEGSVGGLERRERRHVARGLRRGARGHEGVGERRGEHFGPTGRRCSALGASPRRPCRLERRPCRSTVCAAAIGFLDHRRGAYRVAPERRSEREGGRLSRLEWREKRLFALAPCLTQHRERGAHDAQGRTCGLAGGAAAPRRTRLRPSIRRGRHPGGLPLGQHHIGVGVGVGVGGLEERKRSTEQAGRWLRAERHTRPAHAHARAAAAPPATSCHRTPARAPLRQHGEE